MYMFTIGLVFVALQAVCYGAPAPHLPDDNILQEHRVVKRQVIPPQVPVCAQNQTDTPGINCQFVKNLGFCNSAFSRTNCPITCGYCRLPPPTTAPPVTTRPPAPITIPVCRPDQNEIFAPSTCQNLRNIGYCSTSDVVRTSCPVTCGVCRPPPPTTAPPVTTPAPITIPVCAQNQSDTPGIDCQFFQNLGFCNSDFLRTNCPITCGYCRLTTTAPPSTTPQTGTTNPSPTTQPVTTAGPNLTTAPPATTPQTGTTSPPATTQPVTTAGPNLTTAPPTATPQTGTTSPPATTQPVTTAGQNMTTAPPATTTPTETTSPPATTQPGAGGWTEWSNWGQCIPSCGIRRSQIRIRTCTNPPPANAEGGCEGLPYEIRGCNTSECLVTSPSSPMTSVTSASPLTTSSPITLITQGPSPIIPLTPEEEACLQAHNTKRALHGSSPLAWDQTLAQQANSWADTLAVMGKLEHAEDIAEGENLYFSEGSQAATCVNAVESWYDEISKYDFNTPGFSNVTGHFTQVVWNTTAKVGVGVVAEINPVGQIVSYIVARYSPAGNVEGQFSQNVFQTIDRK